MQGGVSRSVTPSHWPPAVGDAPHQSRETGQEETRGSSAQRQGDGALHSFWSATVVASGLSIWVRGGRLAEVQEVLGRLGGLLPRLQRCGVGGSGAMPRVRVLGTSQRSCCVSGAGQRQAEPHSMYPARHAPCVPSTATPDGDDDTRTARGKIAQCTTPGRPLSLPLCL